MINLQELKVGDIITGTYDYDERGSDWFRMEGVYYSIVELKYNSDSTIVEGFRAKVIKKDYDIEAKIGDYINRHHSTYPENDCDYVRD